MPKRELLLTGPRRLPQRVSWISGFPFRRLKRENWEERTHIDSLLWFTPSRVNCLQFRSQQGEKRYDGPANSLTYFVHPPGLERYTGSSIRSGLANSAENQFHIVHKFQVVLRACTICVQSNCVAHLRAPLTASVSRGRRGSFLRNGAGSISRNKAALSLQKSPPAAYRSTPPKAGLMHRT
jgi:hypothetical protein